MHKKGMVSTAALMATCILGMASTQSSNAAEVVNQNSPTFTGAYLSSNRKVDQDGNTALMRAVKHGKLKHVEALIEKKAKLNLKNYEGQTALHLAAKQNQLDIVKVLIKAGASTNIKDNYGKTPLDYAIEGNAIEVAMAIDPSAVTIETSEAGLPVVVAAAAAGGSGVSSSAVLAGVGAVAAGGGIAAAAGGGGGGSGSGASSTPTEGVSSNSPKGITTGGNSGSNTNNNTGSNTGGNSGSNTNNNTGSNTGGNSGSDTDNNGSGQESGGGTSPDPKETGQGGNETSTPTSTPSKTIRIAVIDTGVFFDHPDLRVDKSISRDFYGTNPDATPVGTLQDTDRAHGTLVTGVINARDNGIGITGVAPDAEILALRAGNEKGTFTISALVNAMNYAVDQGQARIINNSWGSSGQVDHYNKDNKGRDALSLEEIQSYEHAVQKGVIVVFAAGNEGLSSPTPQAGLPYLLPELKPLWLAVTAVDNHNQLSSVAHANQCGVAKDWCLAAPGEWVWTTGDPSKGTGYQYISGTSIATPYVSGALALLLDKFPAFQAHPENAVKQLLASADRKFDGYNSQEYGQGIVNIQAALKPAGTTSVPTGSTTTSAGAISLASSHMTLGAASGDALSSQGVLVGFLDMYGRFYQAALHDSVSSQPLDSRIYYFGNSLLPDQIAISKQVTVAFDAPSVVDDPDRPASIAGFDKAKSDSFIQPYQVARASFSLDSSKGKAQMFYNMPMDRSFGFGAITQGAPTLYTASSVGSNPFLGFAAQGMSMMVTSPSIGNKTVFRLGSFFGSEESQRNTLEQRDLKEQKVSGFVGEITKGWTPGFHTTLQAGFMEEQGTFLGSQTSGAFAIEQGTPTWFGALAGSYAWGDNLEAFVTYSQGVSKPQALRTGVFTNFSAIRSDSMSAGINCKACVDKRDTLGITFSRPLRVNSGVADLRLATSTDIQDRIDYTTTRLNLNPTGQEHDVSAYYGMDLTKKLSVQASALYRSEPEHVQTADDEGIFLLKARYSW